MAVRLYTLYLKGTLIITLMLSKERLQGSRGHTHVRSLIRTTPAYVKTVHIKKTSPIRGPYSLGKIIKKDSSSPINKFEPYFRGKNGGVYKMEEEDPQFVYEHDLYLKKQMWDDEEGFVSVFVFHSPHDGVREFKIP